MATEYISREAMHRANRCEWDGVCGDYDGHQIFIDNENMIDSIPAADVVPWEWLKRYADYFCAGVSMPEFVREAKMFYEGTNEAMKGGVIDG